MGRGQGAMEVLLLTAGAVLVAVIVLVVILQSSSSGEGLLGNSVSTYSNELNAENVISAALGGGNPDGGGDPSGPLDPPAIDLFTPSTGLNTGEIHFVFDLSSIQPAGVVQIKGWKQGSVPTITTPTEFTLALLPNYTYLSTINGPTYHGDFSDVMSEENTTYGFYILVCNVDTQCDLEGPISATSKEGPSGPVSPTLSFSAIPSTDAAGMNFTINAQNLLPGATIAMKAWKQGSTPPIDETTFVSTPAEELLYTQTPSGATFVTTFEDFMPQANKAYSFYLMACNPGNPCTIASANATTNGGTPTGTVTALTGTKEIVYKYTTQKCSTDDIPDMPARALKMPNGTLGITRTHTRSTFIVGNDFSLASLASNFGAAGQSCVEVFKSTLVPESGVTLLDVTTFAHKEWISAIYRKPTENKIHLVVHNEFHDPNAMASPPCTSGIPIPGNPCNYFSDTYATATTSGTLTTNMFQKLPGWQTDKDKLIIGAPDAQWPADPNPALGAPVFGLPMTSNIIQRGSYYYMMFHGLNGPYTTAFTNGTCIARTQNLDDPSSWRFWDGSSYTLRMGSAYTSSGSPIPCALLDWANIRNMSDTVTWNSYLKKYVLIDSSNTGNGTVASPYECGYYFSLSDDLISWTMRKRFWDVHLPTGPCSPSQTNAYAYASIIDHAQLNSSSDPIHHPTDPNFEVSGKNPYMYYTFWISGLNRNLERVPVTFCDTAQESCP